MDIFGLIAAFGGGIFGAALGAVPAFIMTGVIATIGAIAAMAGVAGGAVAVNSIAFGSFFGPHVAFGGGVAAAAFAANKKAKLASGTDVVSPLNGLADASVILVGGVFGVIGFLINYLYSGVLALPTDTVAMTVATSGIIVRLAFGSKGLLGKYEGNGPRQWINGKALAYNVLFGLGLGLLVGGIGATLATTGLAGFKGLEGVELDPALATNFPTICFGIAAITLMFATMGLAGPTTHHIVLPAANAAVLCTLKTGNATMGIAMGALFGVITSVVGDFMGNAFNSHCDSHIDPPAMTIFTTTFVIMALWG